MDIATLVDQQISDAMRSRDQGRLSALRMLKTALTNRRVERGRALEDSEAQQVVSTLVKQRRDAIEQFTQVGRTELAEKEAAEIRVLEEFLPAAASAEDVEAAVEAAIAETGAQTVRDLGNVMKAALARLAGKTVDGKAVNEAVRRRLTLG